MRLTTRLALVGGLAACVLVGTAQAARASDSVSGLIEQLNRAGVFGAVVELKNDGTTTLLYNQGDTPGRVLLVSANQNGTACRVSGAHWNCGPKAVAPGGAFTIELRTTGPIAAANGKIQLHVSSDGVNDTIKTIAWAAAPPPATPSTADPCEDLQRKRDLAWGRADASERELKHIYRLLEPVTAAYQDAINSTNSAYQAAVLAKQRGGLDETFQAGTLLREAHAQEAAALRAMNDELRKLGLEHAKQDVSDDREELGEAEEQLADCRARRKVAAHQTAVAGCAAEKSAWWKAQGRSASFARVVGDYKPGAFDGSRRKLGAAAGIIDKLGADPRAGAIAPQLQAAGTAARTALALLGKLDAALGDARSQANAAARAVTATKAALAKCRQ